jgi:hypothetical protein
VPLRPDRAYRRDLLLPLLDEFMAETFMGKPCMSGEDKRLTTLVLKNGYNTVHQGDALGLVDLPAGLPDLPQAADPVDAQLLPLGPPGDVGGLGLARPYLAFILVDKSISPYTLLIGMTFFALAMISVEWMLGLVIIMWWLVSRATKLWPHLRRHPEDVALIPLFIGVTFMMTFVKAYSLTTVHHHKWLTRPVEVVNGDVVRSGSDAPAAPAHIDATPVRDAGHGLVPHGLDRPRRPGRGLGAPPGGSAVTLRRRTALAASLLCIAVARRRSARRGPEHPGAGADALRGPGRGRRRQPRDAGGARSRRSPTPPRRSSRGIGSRSPAATTTRRS